MSAESIVKAQARNLLKKYWVKAIAAMLFTFVPFYIIDGTTTLISCTLAEFIPDADFAQLLAYAIGIPLEIVGYFFFSPMINGYIRAYYRASVTGDFDIGDAFYYFRAGKYKKALSLNLSLLLRMLIPLILFYLPVIAFEVISLYFIKGEFYGSILYHDAYFILSFLSTMIAVLYATRYFTVFTVSVEYETLTVKQIFQCSATIMSDKTISAAKLIFSFFPWILLCLLVLPALYVIPYMTQSLCIGSKWMTKATYEVN